MNHHRSPTHGYPHAIHASLALRHPALLSPLSPAPPFDDLQSNAWINARPPLTGLGISCLHDNPLDSPLGIHDRPLLSSPVEILQVDSPLPAFLYPCLGAQENGRVLQFASPPDQRPGSVQLGLDNDIDPDPSGIIGLIPDVNMYDSFRGQDPPRTGVNPLDTICSVPHDVAYPYGEPPPLTPKDDGGGNNLFAEDSQPEQGPSPRTIQDIMSILVQTASDFSFLPWSSVNSPSVQGLSPSQAAASTSCVATKLELAHVPNNGPNPVSAPCHPGCSSTTNPSPILNAHLGIELSELISRAERFKTKYPERNIDRAWLSHFAGKLSDRGELLNDFRCYVVGCDQRNKRRDHILVHVGAHIGQRPFACSVCPLRFLRKNECKRHEASHSGFRPYSCDICGQSFVRQDLVKRHVKRTHGLKDENQPGAAGQPSTSRKRARLA